MAVENYSGFSEITFDLVSIPDELPIDFNGKEVTRIVANHSSIEIKYTEGFIFINKANLIVGTNVIGIHYSNVYDNDGNGCVSFIDVDTKQYVYTQF